MVENYTSLPGLFVSFEGVDGCGKSTQVQLLKQTLEKKGEVVVTVREPGGCNISESIRQILLSNKNQEMANTTELLLFFAARAQLIHEVIRPALKKGNTVIADRFGFASIAYQGYGHGMNLAWINKLREIACGEIWPDISFLLDIPVDLMNERLRNTGKAKDRMESLESEFFERTRKGYLKLADENDSIKKIDATNSILVIQQKIEKFVENTLTQKNSKN